MTVPNPFPTTYPPMYPGYDPVYVPQAKGWICPVCQAGIAPALLEHCKPAKLSVGVSTTTTGQTTLYHPNDPNIQTYNVDDELLVDYGDDDV